MLVMLVHLHRQHEIKLSSRYRLIHLSNAAFQLALIILIVNSHPWCDQIRSTVEIDKPATYFRSDELTEQQEINKRQ